MDSTDPSHPDFWNSRYLSGQTPWDFGGVPTDLSTFLAGRRNWTGKVLIPGCGSGHEIRAFAEAGFAVTALDLAPAAVDRARENAGPSLARHVFAGDFFRHDFAGAEFDLIYERNFLCSIPPERRKLYRDCVARLLKYRGLLLGYFYYQNPDPEDGPPYGFSWGSADDLFAHHFLLGKDRPVGDSLPIYTGRERWQEWHRTSYDG